MGRPIEKQTYCARCSDGNNGAGPFIEQLDVGVSKCACKGWVLLQIRDIEHEPGLGPERTQTHGGGAGW